MKKIITLIAIFITVLSFGQKGNLIQLKDGTILYTGVVQLNTSLKKNDLYINAKKFFVEKLASRKEDIQTNDNLDTVTSKGFFVIYWKSSFLYTRETRIWHSVKLYLKDGKYKYEITDFSGEYFLPSDEYPSGGWNKMDLVNFKFYDSETVKHDINKEILKEIDELKKCMSKKNSASDF